MNINVKVIAFHTTSQEMSVELSHRKIETIRAVVFNNDVNPHIC